MNPIPQYPALPLLIDGRWIEGTDEGTLEVLNPADGGVIGHLPVAGLRELHAAQAAAARAFPGWSALLPIERFRVITRATALIRERAERIAQLLTLEQGKPLSESRREVALAADIIDFLAEEASRRGSTGSSPRPSNGYR